MPDCGPATDLFLRTFRSQHLPNRRLTRVFAAGRQTWCAPFRQSFWSPWLFLDDVPTRGEVFHHCYERRNTISLPA